MRKPPLCVLNVVVVTLATFRAELVVSVACFPELSPDKVVLRSTPARYKMGVKRLLPQVTLPEQSNEGILTGAEKTALLLVSPSLSVPPESANRSV